MIIHREAIRKAVNAMDWLRDNQADIERIMDVVQENPVFFGVGLGESKIKAAADKLEELVKKEANTTE